ncbi:hypothetical protein [Paucibacter sp. DJ2R-2]|uniref:hypothetical protein n=1 Tax=Paucibacter sp. DJ2R-2 TaxID=2893558 RepID=UPI0021E42E6A|nr:hypothetical protein [Paucibacter sp. DJ2R-2]MCV2438564.1 hypothetical protein [Paucibacter sp. DJ2R-2]
MKTALALAISCALFSGCALTPSQVAVPKPVPLTTGTGSTKSAIQDPWVKALADADALRTNGNRIPLTTDQPNLQAQLELYAAFWRDTEGEYLLLGRDIPGRGRDVAVLTAAYYAVKNHMKEARYAGIFAALFGSFSDTYRVETQAKNYQTASATMLCISEAVDKVPRSAWSMLDATGAFKKENTSLLTGTESERLGALATLNDVFPAVNRTMNKALARLMKDQRELKLSGVNMESLRAAYDKEREARDKAIKQGEELRAGIVSIANVTERAARNAEVDSDMANITALTTLPPNADKCYAGTGG